MPKPRVDAAPAFLLHAYPYRETSLIVEVFSRDHGRTALVARGARGNRSALRGLLMAFVPLELSWFGQGELRTLARAEWVGGQALLRGPALLCGYYLNELLMRLLAREDAHPALFELYRDTVAALSLGAAAEPLLRGFELGLLRELGYGLRLEVDARGERVEEGGRYGYIIEHGAVPLEAGAPDAGLVLSGAALLAMARGDFSAEATRAQAKALMRHLIDHHLAGAPLQSRRVFRELQEL